MFVCEINNKIIVILRTKYKFGLVVKIKAKIFRYFAGKVVATPNKLSSVETYVEGGSNGDVRKE